MDPVTVLTVFFQIATYLPNEQGFSGNEQGLNEPPQATGEQPTTLAGLQ